MTAPNWLLHQNSLKASNPPNMPAAVGIQSYTYIPINPIPVPNGMKDSNGKVIEFSDKKSAFAFLNNESLIMTIMSSDTAGKLTYLVASANAKLQKGSYIIDQIRFRVVPYKVNDKNGSPKLVFILIGIGARATIDFCLSSGSIGTGSIFPLGVEFSHSNATGTISIQSLGVSGGDISPYLNVPSGVSLDNLSETLRKLDAIKLFGMLSDNVNVQPQIIAIDSKGLDINDILLDLYSVVNAPPALMMAAGLVDQMDAARMPETTGKSLFQFVGI